MRADRARAFGGGDRHVHRAGAAGGRRGGDRVGSFDREAGWRRRTRRPPTSAPAKLPPVIVTTVPPSVGPLDGSSPLTNGSGAAPDRVLFGDRGPEAAGVFGGFPDRDREVRVGRGERVFGARGAFDRYAFVRFRSAATAATCPVAELVHSPACAVSVSPCWGGPGDRRGRHVTGASGSTWAVAAEVAGVPAPVALRAISSHPQPVADVGAVGDVAFAGRRPRSLRSCSPALLHRRPAGMRSRSVRRSSCRGGAQRLALLGVAP